MRRNTKKFKPNPSSSLRHSIWSSSIRDIIGDRRFNGQFSHVNTHGTEGIKKAEKMKVGNAEADNLPNLGRNVSSIQSEAPEDTRRCSGDLAAKTSEYAFFKKMKETTSSNIHVYQKHHENQLNNAQQSDHFTREEIPNVQKESIKDARFSFPLENKRDDPQYSFLSPPCHGSKNSEINNVLGLEGTNIQKVTHCEYDWLSSPAGRETMTSGNKEVFSMKREKLRRLVADKSSYNVNEVSSKGFDLVSALISRILPENQCQDETDTKHKQQSFSEKGHEANKRKFIKSRQVSFLDDGTSRSSERLLEWDPNGSESWFIGDASNSSISYDCWHSRKLMESGHVSYLEDDFPRSSERLLEWDPNGSESWFIGDASNSSISYDCWHSRKLMESGHVSYLEDDFPRSSERLLEWESNDPESLLVGNASKCSTTIQYPEEAYRRKSYLEDDFPRSLEWDPIWHNDWHTDNGSRIPNFGYESSYFKPKLLEHSQPLLLGWEEKSEKDEYKFSGLDLQTSAPPYITEDHFLESSIIPYTPEEHFIRNYNEKEEESFDFLDQSPAEDLLQDVLNSSDKKEKNFFCSSSDDFSEGRLKSCDSFGYMKGFRDKYYDQIGYPLLLHDTSDNES